MNCISFNIRDHEDKKILCSAPLCIPNQDTYGEDFGKGYFEYISFLDSINFEKARLCGHNKYVNWRVGEKLLDDLLVIHSGESLTFKSILSLPILQESNLKFDRNPIYCNDLKDNYKFVLYYGADSELIKKTLPDYILMDLERNGIKIFDGIIKSKPIPLKEK